MKAVSRKLLKSKPLVSIVMPVRNAGTHLVACLDSIAAQSCTDYELLAIDDGSSDDSATILADRAREDPRIRLSRLAPVGIVRALNLGLNQARATLIARMDADDLMHERRLELQLECFHSQPELVLVASQVCGFPDSQMDRGMREYLRWQNSVTDTEDIANQRYIESPLCHPSVTFKRAPVLAAGGYRDGEFPEDYELWLRLLALELPMYKLAQEFVQWRQSDLSLSKTDPRYQRSAFDQLRAQYLAQDPRLATSRPLVIWGAGRRTRQRCRWLIERGFKPSAWIDIDPKKIGQSINGIRVHEPRWLVRYESTVRPFVLVYVTNHGARDIIASELTEMGYCCGTDFLMVG
jgi:glycosyltransferase involved in cell wall biosynthesis